MCCLCISSSACKPINTFLIKKNRYDFKRKGGSNWEEGSMAEAWQPGLHVGAGAMSPLVAHRVCGEGQQWGKGLERQESHQTKRADARLHLAARGGSPRSWELMWLIC